MSILIGITAITCERDPWPVDYPPIQSCPGTPTVLHGGETYPTVLIDKQCWMAKNLNVGTRIDHNKQSSDNDTIEKYCLLNVEENCDLFGGLYQWDELMQYDTNNNGQGLCPEGWHIPKLEDYVILFNYAKGQMKTLKKKGYCWLSSGGIEPGDGLKEECFENDGQTGFDILPAGYIDLQKTYPFLGQLSRAYMWISNHNYFTTEFNNVFGNVSEENLSSVYYSVRCIKDTEESDND